MPLKKDQPKDMYCGQSGERGPENTPATERDLEAVGVSWPLPAVHPLAFPVFMCDPGQAP